mmetsp:Transcript_34817/g.64946  ORF Transcript_34817/g.64946 Transcript_34817/m.64946 type:complete len:281 (-) Transcript_34817:142-984(-)
MPTGLNDSMKKSSVSAPVSVASSNAVVNFLKDLDKIQEQQMHYSKKIEKEKRRKTQLDEDIKIMKEDILAMKSKTRDGQLYRDEEAAAKKTIARLEKKMQLTRIQLSVAHSENSDMRKSIDAMRLNKTMYLQIRNDMVTELAETKKKIIAAQKENISINNKKLKAKSDKTNIKNQMISDMEEFSREMQVAKENISSNQETVIEAIREKMTSQFVDEWDEFEGENTSATNHTAPSEFRETLAATISRSDEDEIRALLKATNLTSVDELLGNMQQCEDSIFR